MLRIHGPAERSRSASRAGQRGRRRSTPTAARSWTRGRSSTAAASGCRWNTRRLHMGRCEPGRRSTPCRDQPPPPDPHASTRAHTSGWRATTRSLRPPVTSTASRSLARRRAEPHRHTCTDNLARRARRRRDPAARREPAEPVRERPRPAPRRRRSRSPRASVDARGQPPPRCVRRAGRQLRATGAIGECTLATSTPRDRAAPHAHWPTASRHATFQPRRGRRAAVSIASRRRVDVRQGSHIDADATRTREVRDVDSDEQRHNGSVRPAPPAPHVGAVAATDSAQPAWHGPATLQVIRRTRRRE